MPDKEDLEIKPTSSKTLFGGVMESLGSLVSPLYSWGITIITIIFLAGVVAMIMSILFRNGQWQKYGQSTIYISFIVLLILRGLPILILSMQSSQDVDALLNSAITMLSYSALYLGLISIAVSLLFRLGYKLIEHPDFHRWSKNLVSVSLLMMAFAVLVPYVFPLL
ncbi:vacuolar-type H+-ATPase subunit I/STV1 [Cytobacillus purgationiresistens]|uniref:Vacuolar-type H+-ATPase subunit I/STV1 n=2 Tax=Cytobacillus purgationiresistens TaxID=863449 RepID=A0ABU0AJ02_9BACI|nr:vacuolar-type H+-ATPase subunit I/STV1 [Cytobacillus purgationiresistens]